MFTGIVEEQGQVTAIEMGAESARLRIAGGSALVDLRQGDSVAVNGCCLTAVELGSNWFVADVMLETLKRTNLGSLSTGSPVNLERPMRANGRFDGHIVQGHIDGVGRIAKRVPGDRWEMVHIIVKDLGRYIVEKGSIAIDGVSLTVVSITDLADGESEFVVSLIPETLRVTTLGTRKVGDEVNIEVDILAKYVERMKESA